LKASEDITEHDLRAARHDLGVTAKLDDNPLQYVLMNLVDLLEADSEESQQRERKKAKVGHTHVPISQPDFDERPVTPQNTQPRFPISFEGTLDNKRKVSDTSFGSRSTETTPTKLDHPEAKVQSLQDRFVSTIIAKVWWGKIDITWAQGRHMFLTYTEYPPPSPQPLTVRTSRTSFQYARPTADGDPLIGRVKAIADGALILKTNKSKDEGKYCVWSKQRCAISFEVIISLCRHSLIVG